MAAEKRLPYIFNGPQKQNSRAQTQKSEQSVTINQIPNKELSHDGFNQVLH